MFPKCIFAACKPYNSSAISTDRQQSRAAACLSLSTEASKYKLKQQQQQPLKSKKMISKRRKKPNKIQCTPKTQTKQEREQKKAK